MGNVLSLLLGAGPKDALYLGQDIPFHILFSHYLHVVRENGKNHFLLAGKTPAFLEPLGCYAKPIQRTSEGFITRATLEASVNPRVSLLSLPWADPISGIIHPMHEIAEFCRDREILLHIDGSSVIGKIDFRIQDIEPAYFSFEGGVFSEHPLYLPPVPPQYLTDVTQQIEQKIVQFDRMVTEVARLRDGFEEAVIAKAPHVHLPFRSLERVPDIAAFSFPHTHSDYMGFRLHRRGLLSQPVDEHTLSLLLPPSIDEAQVQHWTAALEECLHEHP